MSSSRGFCRILFSVLCSMSSVVGLALAQEPPRDPAVTETPVSTVAPELGSAIESWPFYLALQQGERGPLCLVHPVAGPGPMIDPIDPDLVEQSQDGMRIAYPARIRGKWQVIVDQKPAFEKHVPVVARPRFSPDGSHLAFIAQKQGKEYVVLDGEPGPLFDAISRKSGLTFDSTGTRFAYVARRRAKWVVVIDGAPGKECEDVCIFPPLQFDAGGEHVFYVTKQSGWDVPVLDGQEGAPLERVGECHLSPVGGRYACVVAIGFKRRMLLDGQLGPEYDQIRCPSFSPDGRHLAYFGIRGGKPLLVVDGQESGEHGTPSAEGILFSPDGLRTAFATQVDSRWQAVVGGEGGPFYDNLLARTPCFSEDGAHVGYVGLTREGAYVSVVDGVETGAPVRGVAPESILACFAGSTWHVAHPSPDGTRVVVDGVAGPGYERVLMPIQHTSDGISYFAIREGTLFRVTQSLH